MGTLIYYLLLPLIYAVAISPSWILYRISDFIFVIIYYVVGYRKKVVQENLKNAFPEKSDSERKEIEIKHFKYICDLLLESIKTITMTKRYILKHLKFNDIDKMNAYYEEGKSLVFVMGHYGNWELAGPCFTLSCKHQLNVVYKKLSNPFAEKLFVKARTTFGTKVIPMETTLRAMAANRKIIDATTLIADQTPSDPKTGFWLNFLNQETLVFTGPEKLSKMFDYPIVYMHIDRVKRGYYEITPTVLFDNPKETSEEEITRAFFSKLEEEIKNKPETWLWSHKRWKHKRLTTNN